MKLGIIAERAAEAVGLDRVLFIPTAVSPLKAGRELVSAADRWAMLKIAIRGNPRFQASDLEIRRGGVSYTVDTLRELRRRTRADLHLILGADAARLLPRWRSIDVVRELATFVLVSRPGHRVRARMPKQHIVEAPLLEISSTEIRDRVRRGLSIRYLVPEGVERHIRRRGLYR
jgi:nicotinate-nucleotide adenylyltransferase